MLHQRARAAVETVDTAAHDEHVAAERRDGAAALEVESGAGAGHEQRVEERARRAVEHIRRSGAGSDGVVERCSHRDVSTRHRDRRAELVSGRGRGVLDDELGGSVDPEHVDTTRQRVEARVDRSWGADDEPSAEARDTSTEELAVRDLGTTEPGRR